MNLLNRLLDAVARGARPGPFALVRSEAADTVEVFTGRLGHAATLAELPPAEGPYGPQTLALVPYRQIAERGFACVDDGAPLEYLSIGARERVGLAEVLAALPQAGPACVGGGFDTSDEEYARTVRMVLAEEIGQGEGANFVISRTFRARLTGSPLTGALAALRRLLTDERGAYWTFLVHTGTRILVGASPERHVSVADGLVMMNPISGTFRHPGAAADRSALLEFLADPKETDELYMVLDEELKMMAAVAEEGGQVIGPYLKEMSQLAHTEYLLAGEGSRDVREVLRETMFAPTVTGSPMENACRVIARHESTGRGYYGGVLALLGRDAAGRQTLDAPILIRTAEISPAGELSVRVGATLVRHSTPAAEVAETHAKAAAVLTALGLRPAPPRPPSPAAGFAADPAVRAALAARNDRLARFWLDRRRPGELVVPALAGRTVLVVDAEDTFTGMLAHQLRALGPAVTVRPWHAAADLAGYDLVVAGPGPGDPESADPKMVTVRRILAGLLAAGRPVLAVCLGHQLLAGLLGLRLHRRAAPYQGTQRRIDLFGTERTVGFYSTFTALAAADRVESPYGGVECARDAEGAVHAVRGRGFAGVQFHPESVLSRDGLAVLTQLLGDLVPATGHPAGAVPGAPPVTAGPGRPTAPVAHTPSGRG